MPEVGIGTGEFQRHMKFSGLSGRDNFDGAFADLIRARVSQSNDLARIQRGARFHERAMRVHDNRARGFVKGGFVCEFSFQDHGRLNKEALAAPPSLGGFHHTAASANLANFNLAIIGIL